MTLDPDVSAQLERLRRERDQPFKTVVNAVLREGLKHLGQSSSGRELFQTSTVSLGRCLPGSIDDVAEVLAVAEGERPK